jgi:hypothetical protein
LYAVLEGASYWSETCYYIIFSSGS